MTLHPLAQRDWLAYRICQGATAFAISAMYSIAYQHEERLYPLKDTPFILLPKHQSLVDILLEGKIIRDLLNRPAYYVMKTELPDSLRFLGGIKIARPKDLLKQDAQAMGDREKVRKAIEQRNMVYDCIRSVYDDGEIIVVHPEGERNYDRVAPINRPAKCLRPPPASWSAPPPPWAIHLPPPPA